MKKIALITGASKGIGRALADVFAKHHYSLILIARTHTELEKLQSELHEKYQCQAKILSADLSSLASIDQIINRFKEELPHIEVLVNNAGFGLAKQLTDIPIIDVEGMLTVNIHALTMLTYKILPFMLAKKSGKILNVASTAAYVPGPYMAMYYASKSYVLSFSVAIAEEYQRSGVHISVLCPGVTKTSFHERSGHSKLLSGKIPIMSAEKVALIAYKGLIKNKRVIIAGFSNKLAVLLMHFIPNFLLEKLMAFLNKPRQ